MDSIKKSYLFAGAAVFFWSTVATAFKIALRGLSPLGLLFWASIFSFLALVSILLLQGKWRELIFGTRSDYLRSLVLGMLNPVAYYLCLFFAYDKLPAREALSLNYTWAIMLGILSVPLLGQKIGIKGIVGLLAGFAGVAVIIGGKDLNFSNSESPEGIVAALLSAVIWALYWIFNMKDKRDSTVKLTMNFFFGSLAIGLISIFSGGFEIVSPQYIFAAGYIGFFEMGITFFLWLTALKHSKSTAAVGSLVYLSPLLSLFFINAVLGEEIPASTVFGLILILGGIIISSRKKIKTR